jgi:vancomycin aglycone glucosyltransferase
VHHCGAGTTAAAARAGVPQIPVPHAFDQPWWSSRLGQLGVAGAALPRDFTGAQLGDGIAAVVNDGDVVERARVLGEHIRSRSGVAAAADVITRDEAR